MVATASARLDGSDLLSRAAAVRLLALDVDGVMTDGGIILGGSDAGDYKRFNSQDGLGIKLLQRCGIEVAILTGRHSQAVTQRAKELQITSVYQAVRDKRQQLDELRQTLNLQWENCAFMGDDLIDLGALSVCGLALAPANARPIIKAHVHHVTALSGGSGAVREICELILQAQNQWQGLCEFFLHGSSTREAQ